MAEQKIKQPIKNGVAKTPVIMQMEALECGAASLSMILAYYGLWVPLEKVRLDCGVSRDGSNAANIFRAAQGYGLDSHAYRLDIDEIKTEATFPCIIHWNFNHFVVLCGFQGEHAILCDPGRGRVKVDMEEFDRCFTGICLTFAPTERFQPGGERKTVWGFAKKRLRGTGVVIAMVVVTSLANALLNIINPAMQRVFMDRLLTQQNPEWLYPFIILMIALAAIQLFLTAVSSIYQLKMEGKLAISANSSYMWHVLCLPMEFFTQRAPGDIAMRKSLNQGIASSIINTLAPLVLDFGMMILYLVVMLRNSVLMTAIGVGAMLLNMLMARFITDIRVNRSRAQMRDMANMESTAAAGINMIETIKASGAENGFFGKWAGYQASVQKNTRIPDSERLLTLIPSLILTIADGMVLIIGAWLTMQGHFTAGSILMFQTLMASFSGPANSLISAGQSMTELTTDMERIEDVMEYPTQVTYRADPPGEDEVFDKLSGKIELRNVTFGYSRLAPPLIENFSMTLEPGCRVAFVGPSGCGKSTLSKLISGLYEPWSGEILFDGKPIQEIRREIFTGSLSVVDQNIILFDDTVRNNIKMWDDSIEDFEMILAARDAQIHSDIVSREGGYDCMISAGGRDFSGGQRQRLEIARVLAQDPTIIIMDEATSALDARTEFDVINAVRNRGISCVVVAHRLSTIRDCEEIIVLEKGKVVERGTHSELYHAGGLYTQLVSNE